MNAVEFMITNESQKQFSRISIAFSIGYALLALLIVVIVFGNITVLVTVACDRKLRVITTNKFIVSLAVSDLLIGIVVMPLSLFAKLHSNTWDLGERLCTFHLMSAVFSTTASIVHLVAISLDRYFAIMFPTEYQRHSISTSALPYVIMIWVMSLAVSSTLFLGKPLASHGICWIEDPQYLVLSSFLSFFLPGAIVVYLYVKIYQKLRKHKLFMFGTTGLLKRHKSYFDKKTEKNRALPEVIIEEVKSRRGSRLSQAADSRKVCSTRAQKSDCSRNEPEMRSVALVQRRWRSPTISAEALERNRTIPLKKRVTMFADSPSVEVPLTVAPLASPEAQKNPEIASAAFQFETEEKFVGSSKPNAAYLVVQKSVKINEKPLNCKEVYSACLLELPSAKSCKSGHSSPEKSVKKTQFDHSSHSDTKNLLKKKEAEKVTEHLEVQQHINPSLPIQGDGPTLTRSAGNVHRDALFSNLKIPKLWRSSSATVMSVTSTATSTNNERFYRRISMNSYNSSLTESDSAGDAYSRRSSTWSTARATVLGGQLGCAVQGVIPSLGRNTGHFLIKKPGFSNRGKLKRIATQVTKAVRQKRRESIAMRRESRATRVVAAILSKFTISSPFYIFIKGTGFTAGNAVPAEHMKLSLRSLCDTKIFVLISILGTLTRCFCLKLLVTKKNFIVLGIGRFATV